MEDEDLTYTIEELLKESNDKFIIEDLIPFLKIPSIFFNKEGILEAKNYIISYISDFIEDFQEFEGVLNPLILAKVNGELKENLLIYMMYDTQPISNEEDWISEPFEAEIKVLPSPLEFLGKCIIARGVYNSKSPLMSFLNTIKILKETD